MIPAAPFASARLKLDRAKLHIFDLDAKITAHLKSAGQRMIIKDHPERRQRAVWSKADKPLPAEISLILGDAIHNLRASLDLMTWEVLADFNPQLNQIQFPVGKTAKHFEDMLAHRQIKRATPRIVQAFRDLQVYEKGNDDLWNLHWLDIADKHQTIPLVVSAFVLHRFSPDLIEPIYSNIRIINEGSFVWLDVQPRALIAWPLTRFSISLAEANRRFKQYEESSQVFVVSFGDQSLALKGRPIVPTLNQMASEVSKAVDRIASALT